MQDPSVPDPQYQQAIQLAISRLQTTVLGAIARTSDGLGTAAIHAASNADRQALLNAKHDFDRRQSAFKAMFTRVLRRKVDEGFSGTVRKAEAPPTDWTALSLVSDADEEERLTAKQLGLAVSQACDWELRELAAFAARIREQPAVEPESNPLRPEVLGQALFRAIETVSDVPETRKVLARHLSQELAREMKGCYQLIIEDFRRRGIDPITMNTPPRSQPASGGAADALQRSPAQATELAAQLAALFGRSFDDSMAAEDAPFVSSHGAGYGQPQSVEPPIELPDLAPLIDQIAHGLPDTASIRSTSDNLIWRHRQQLMSAARTPIDRSVVEAVGVLFEQVLGDGSLAPPVAGLIGGLQLPVLRAALQDAKFFVTPDHPLRTFVNRLWALAGSFEDFESGAGRRFIDKANRWLADVQPGDLVDGPAMEQRLAALEALACEPPDPEAAEQRATMATVLERKESELRAQQSYVRALERALSGAQLPEFLATFIAQIWSQAIVLTAARGTTDPIDCARCIDAMEELVQSVQPMSTPHERSSFLVKLPALSRTLRLGLQLVEWPSKAQDAFFAQLQPAQTAAMRAPALDQLRTARLAATLRALRGARIPGLPEIGGQLPSALEEPSAGAAPEAGSEPIDPQMTSHFLPAEALTVGLVPDQTRLAAPQAPPKEWLAKADPLDEPGIGPLSGRALFDGLRAGQLYRMQIDQGWQKMRLTLVSEGRAFFVFTHGDPEHTITLTARMMLKLCELRRLRSVDRGDLVARAARRARSGVRSRPRA